MSQSRITTWVQLILAIIALAALIVFRSPLKDWFAPLLGDEPALSVVEQGQDRGTAGSKDASASPSASHRFSPEALAALKAAFGAYEQIRIALALDQVAPLPAAAAKIRSTLESAKTEGLPAPVQTAMDDARKHAAVVGAAPSAKAARTPFGALSQTLFRVAQSDPRLQTGWHVFSCPMAEGFTKWFQGPENIENPYMGQAMLACGTKSEWTAVVPASQPVPDADEVAYWTCSMDPSVRQHTPGTCPICKMDLTPVTHENLRTGEVLVDAVRRQRIGVRTQKAERRTLVRPIRAVGELVWDESKVHDVTARVDGWVEDLRVTRTGDVVTKGATLLRFYSPELLTTQRELLLAPSKSPLADIARERLRLSGMSSQAIKELTRRKKPRERVSLKSPVSGVVVEKRVNEGAHVKSGALLYRIAERDRIWLEARVFEQDLPHLTVGQEVQVDLPHAPGQQRKGQIAYVYPTLEPGVRTGQIRIELDNEDGVLRPGMLANVTFEVPLGERLAIPVEAVIYTGPRRLVFVDKGQGRLRPKVIEVGPVAGDWITIESGLQDGDVVVTSGAFLVAAESRIRSAASYWEASDESQ